MKNTGIAPILYTNEAGVVCHALACYCDTCERAYTRDMTAAARSYYNGEDQDPDWMNP